MTKLLRAFASLAVWVIPVVFVACGGDTSAPNTNKPPISSFTAASNSIKAGGGRYQARTVRVADTAWNKPVTVLQNDGGGDDIKLALNPNGDAATVFWTATVGVGFQFASRSSSSPTWTAARGIADKLAGATFQHRQQRASLGGTPRQAEST
jgi:hypothetical protein